MPERLAMLMLMPGDGFWLRFDVLPSIRLALRVRLTLLITKRRELMLIVASAGTRLRVSLDMKCRHFRRSVAWRDLIKIIFTIADRVSTEHSPSPRSSYFIEEVI